MTRIYESGENLEGAHPVSSTTSPSLSDCAADVIEPPSSPDHFGTGKAPPGNERSSNGRNGDPRGSTLQTPDFQVPEMKISDIRASNIRTPDPQPSDVRHPDVRASNIQKSDVQTSDIHIPDIHIPDIQTSDIQPLDLQTLGARPSSEETAKFRPAAVSTTKIRKRQIKVPQLPRLGFLGVGWIGRHRLEALIRDESAQIVGVADSDSEAAKQAQSLAGNNCKVLTSLDELLNLELDGVVIATPSALHAQQCIQALNSGHAVFCQKPLGRNSEEVRSVLDAARQADRLLRVDFSYRYTEGIQQLRRLVQEGQLGHIFSAELVFHNSYGPDKAWFYNPELSGGGCLMDLGIHLVDLAFWLLNCDELEGLSGRLLSQGHQLSQPDRQVEDFAEAELRLGSGCNVRLACSWKLHAGCDARIEVALHGTQGGAVFRNLNGSFYDFQTEHFTGRESRVLCTPPDSWGGRALLDWARKLASDSSFEEDSSQLLRVAELLDDIRSASNRIQTKS